MNNRIRRTSTIVLFVMVLALGAGLGAQAQPLDLPDAPKGGPIELPSPITLQSPAAGATVSYPDMLVWSNEVKPSQYLLKVTINGTGESIKFDVPLDHCTEDGVCSIGIGSTPIFDYLEDGGGFVWRVIAKYSSENIKSAAHYQIADTVAPPQHLAPADDAVLLPIHNLTWVASVANAKDTLIVREAETKVRVLKAVLVPADCGATCAVSPHGLADFEVGVEYEWFVKVKGYNGDKAKSPIHRFIVPEVSVTK